MNFVLPVFFGLTQLFELFKSHKNCTPKCMQTPSLYRHAGPACSVHSRDYKDNVLEVKTRPRFRSLAPVWAKMQEKPLWMSIDPLYFSSFVPTVLPTNIAWWEWTHERGGLDVEMNFVSRIFFGLTQLFELLASPLPNLSHLVGCQESISRSQLLSRINLKIETGHQESISRSQLATIRFEIS